MKGPWKLSVEIRECYSGKPVPNARKAIESLLAGIPQKYLRGLKTVVLRDSGSLSHNRKRSKTWRRKKKVPIKQAAGLYHAVYQGEPAWIEIFVDNVMSMYKEDFFLKIGLRIPFARDLIFADPLYHELGHHIHKALMPEYKETEDVADKWRRRLTRYYLLRKYWYVIGPLLAVLWPISKVTKAFRAKGKQKPPAAKDAQ